MTSPSFAWWQTGVIYQIYPRSFYDANGDGIGDLQGIIDRLDYLVTLGVDAIWISPIYPSPMADFGYDVADYCDIHPIFGDLATFDCLLAEAHHRGIRVILDFVPNHTSDRHPWFQESRASRDSARRDWYIWRDAKPDGSAPNNWVSMFGGPAWTWDEATGQYYLHLFLKEQPDLNWRNPAVQSAMLEVLRFWLDRGVDGFRMDVVGFIMKDEQMRDNPYLPGADLQSLDRWAQQEHRHDIDQPEAHDMIRTFRQLIDSYPDRVVIGEIWAEPRSRWADYYGQDLSELNLPFNFALMSQPWQASAIRASVAELEASIPPGAWPNYVLGSHDKPRLASRFGPQAVRLAAMLLLTLRGTPTLYNGEELGMANGDVPPDRMQDPQGLNIGPDKSRDPYRTPFQWSAAPYAGFSRVEPWLPVADGHEAVNAEAQNQDSRSVLNLYRQLIALRRRTPALNGGSYTPILTELEHSFVYLREAEGQRYLVALNFSGEAQTIGASDLGETGQVLLTTNLESPHDVTLAAINLGANEGVIIMI
ncbi:alpha-amylase family glycosyl hydrolase [Aggregatilinea lenta]|uniref:alpha-amylase family glycosyl hydrolase n=1 Tax=Aggregatilinea lenta TaxID=913108 RepID=UPI000E5A94F6|nr:alpha-amylase family glycosyl hydrolase [Aggregatilinea lenta]